MEKSTDAPAKSASTEKPAGKTPKTSVRKRLKPSRVTIAALVSLVVGIAIGVAGMYAIGVDSSSDAPTSTVGQVNENEMTTTYPDIVACDVLIERDVEKVLGYDVTNRNTALDDEDPNNPPVPSACIYSPDSDQSAITRLFMSNYQNDINKAKASLDEFRAASIDGKSVVSISNLGDEAYWSPAPLAQLQVRKADTVFVLILGDPNPENRTEEKTVNLGRRVVDRY